MTRRRHRDWITAYVELFDGRTEAPRRLHLWTAIAVLGGTLTRQVWIDEVTFRLYPNWFITFVSPPGVSTKSTAINLGISLLRELDHIYLAADNTTYPAFIRDLARRSREILDEQAADDLDSLYIRQCAVTAAISELSTFFKVEDEDMVNGLTDLWDCRSIMVKDTKTSGTDIVEHPFVNLIAGAVPDWVRTKLRGIAGWGLSSRMIMVYTDKKARPIARPSKLWSVGEYERLTRDLVVDLRLIAEMNGPMEFTPAADALAHSWYARLSQQIEAHAVDLEGDRWTAYFLARKQTHVHKLAMVLSASRSDDRLIQESDLLAAIAHVEEVEAEIPRIFDIAPDPTPLARIERTVLEKIGQEMIAAGGSIPRFVAFTKASRFVDSSTANKIIDNAVGRGVYKQLVSSAGTFLTLPTARSEPEE